MANDFVNVSSATTGATIEVAAETIGGVAYQVMKLAAGGSGSTVHIDATSGVPAASSVGVVVAMIPGASVSAVISGTISVAALTTGTISVSGTVPVTGTIQNVASISTILGTAVVSVVPGVSVLASITVSATIGTVIAVSGVTAVSAISTVVTVLGTVAVSQVAAVSVSSIVPVTTAVSVSVSGWPVWMNPTQGVNVSTVSGTINVNIAAAGTTIPVNVVAGGAAPGTTATTQTNVTAQVVWFAPTQTVHVTIDAGAGGGGSVTTAAPSISATGQIVFIVGGQSTTALPVYVSQINPPAGGGGSVTTAVPSISATGQIMFVVGGQSTTATPVYVSQVSVIAGGYVLAAATSSAMSSSTQVLLMSVYNSTGSTLGTSGWTVGAGSVLAVYGLGFGWSQAAANNQATFMLLVTASGATFSTAAAPGQAWASVTFSTGAALTTFVSTGWGPGSLVATNTSITALAFPWFIPGPAVVGVAVAATSSGATAYASINASILPTMPYVQAVTFAGGTTVVSGTISISGVMSVTGALISTVSGTVLVSQANIAVVTTAASVSVSGYPVWLNPTQGVNVSAVSTLLGTAVVSVVPGVSVLASITVSATVGTIIAVSGVTAVSAVSTVVTVLGTAVVTIAQTSVSVASIPTVLTVVTLLGTVFVSQVNPPGAAGLAGGYWAAAMTTSVMSSSTQTVLMSVYNSTGSTLGTGGWTIGSGSALMIYGLGFGVSQAAANMQYTFMVAVTNTGATLSTIANTNAWAIATFSTGVALTTFISTGWVPGSLVATNTSITTLAFPWIIPGPAVVGLAVAATSSGATVYASVQASVVGTIPIVQPVTGTVAIGNVATVNTLLAVSGVTAVSAVSTVVTVLGTVAVSVVASAILGTVIAVSGITAVSAVSTVVTVLGTVAVSVVASAIVGTVIAVSGVTAVSAVSTVVTVLGTVLVNVAVSATVGTIIAVSGVTAVSAVSTIVTILGTQIVTVVPGVSVLASITVSATVGTVIAISGITAVSNVSTIVTLLGTVNVSVAGALVGGYMLAVATTTAISSSTQVILMSVYNSTGSTLGTTAWTVGAGSALVVYGLGFGVSQAAANMQYTFMLLATATGTTLSTVSPAWAQVTFSTGVALSTIISTGWIPGTLVGINTSITALGFPLVIPGPVIVGLGVAATSSGATVYGTILASIVNTMPIVQPVAISGAVPAVTSQLNTTGAAVWLAPTQTMTVTAVLAYTTTALATGVSTGLVVIPKDFARVNWVCAVSSTVVGSSTTLAMTIWTGNTTGIGSTTAYAVPAGKVLRIVAFEIGVQSSVVGAFQQFGVIVATATVSLTVVATVGVAVAVGYLPLAASNVNVPGLAVDISAGTSICPAVIVGTSHTILGALIQGYLF